MGGMTCAGCGASAVVLDHDDRCAGCRAPQLVRTCMPMRLVDTMLLLRPDGSKIARDEENARTIRDCVDVLDDQFYDQGLDWLNDEQVASLWCADPADTFGMLDDFKARLGCDADEVDDVAEILFDLLPVESQQQLREMELWGAV